MSLTKRRSFFRLLAILLGVLPVLGIELALRLSEQPSHHAPQLDLSELKPLFEEQEPGVLTIPEERFNLFRPASFKLEKEGQYRIFALGGSTTQGEPYATETAFPEFVGLYLRAASPERQVEIVNCGGLSYASYRVLEILKETLQYSPDLIVLYSGHNEYLERRSYLMPAEQSWLRLRIASRINNLLANPKQEEEKSMDRIKQEVDALLDYQGGLEDYHREAEWQRGVVDHYRDNLTAMIEACRLARVPIVLVRPACNLLDSPPFKTELSPGLTSKQRKRFEEHWKQAIETTDAADALLHVESALAIDPKHAGVLFLKGQLLIQAGNTESAREALIAAKDCDVCPLRMTSALLQAFDEVVSTMEIPVVDAQVVFDAENQLGMSGKLQMVDHIHPTVEGHKLLGNRIGREILVNGLFSLPHAMERDPVDVSDSTVLEARFDSLCSAHLRALNPAYYERARQRLAGLRLWTQGRAKKLKSRSQR